MRIVKLLIPTVTLLVLTMCRSVDNNSSLQNINRLCCAYDNEYIAKKMQNIRYIHWRTAASNYDGYELIISPTSSNECVINVVVRVDYPLCENNNKKSYNKDDFSANNMFFKILNIDSLDSKCFRSFEKEGDLFQQLYGCNVSDIIDLIFFCKQCCVYCITEIKECESTSFLIETSDLYLLNSTNEKGLSIPNMIHLRDAWFYEKK